MPHTGVSLARTRDRKWSQPVSARRSIRSTSWPPAFPAGPAEPQAGQLLDAEQLGEREHPVADGGGRVAGEVKDAGEFYGERGDECLDEVGDEDRLQQTRAEQRQRRPRRVVGEERAEEE